MDYNKTIVITGTSTGIGKARALHFIKMGFRVFAGVRKQADGDNLKKEASDRLIPIILDVTDENSISKAASIIEKETGGNVFGLINNAGIGRGGALEVTPVAEIRKLMAVNVIGLMAVTQAFIPMLRKGKGRIINIGSTSSLLAFPGASAYSASKVAAQALTSAKPKPYYLVGKDAKGAAKAAKLPKGLLDWIILKRIQKLGNEFRTLTNQTSIKTPNLDELCR